MNKQIKQTEAHIKSGISRIYKELFGQGPDSIYVNIWGNILTCELVGALTSLEETLIASLEGEELVHSIRNYFLSVGGDPIKKWLEEEFENLIEGRTYMINKDKNKLYTFFIFENNII
jgi:uncharacterized protein YbcI